MYHGVTQQAEPTKDSRRADAAADEPSARRTKDTEGEPSSDEQTAPSNKKERVLHTRVPAVLERELKRFADNLRIPVSNLVRTILEDAVSVADAASENVEARLKRAAHQIEVEREKLKKRVHVDPLEGVFAFQEITLAMPATCAKCQKPMKRGDHAQLGLTDAPARTPDQRIFICDACLPEG
jgi:hypothetical protein